MTVRFGTEMVTGCALCGKDRKDCPRLFGMDHTWPRQPTGVCFDCAHRVASAFIQAAPDRLLMVIRPQTEWEENHNKMLIGSNLRRMLEEATEKGQLEDVHEIIERAKQLGVSLEVL